MENENKKSKEKPKEKKKLRKPKESIIDKIDIEKVSWYASLGLTQEEIALLLEISERTLRRYKKNEIFLSALTKGKLSADSKVVGSLLKRCIGFEYEEKEYKINEKGSPILKKIIKKQAIPDILAINSWLNNRRRHQWAYNPKPTTGIEDDKLTKLKELAIKAMEDEV